MYNSGDAAEQVVRMSLEGAEVALKITGAAAKNLAAALYTVLKDQKKTKGKARIETMLREKRPLKVYTIKKEDCPEFARQAKGYGILYALSRKGNADAPGQRTGMQLVVSFRQCAACRALPDPDITPRQHGRENTMKLIWTRELDAQNPWEPDFHGVFFYQESGISFYYKDEHLVRCVHGQMDEPEILFEGKRGIRGSTI